MKEQIEILILGKGGDGVLTLGDIIINIFNIENYKVSMYTFYASQMRGGEVGCIIKINFKNEEIINPTITSPDYYLILDNTYIDKYMIYKNENSKFLISENKIKSKNIILLKNFINMLNKELKNNEQNEISEESVISSLKIKFKNNDTFNEMKNLYIKYKE